MKKEISQFPFTANPKNTVLKITLNSKEEKYRSIIENSAHAFFLTITDGTILETNHAATVMFDYSADEFKKIKRWQFIDHTAPNVMPALQQREKDGFIMLEATGIKKNGKKFPIEITSSIFTDTNGECRSSTMVSDISLRKKAEAAMRLSNERYDLVVKATKDLVWDWDLITGEIYRNGSSLIDVYGHKSNDNINNIQDWGDYIHPQDKEKIKNQIEYYVHSTAETDFNFEYRFRREDGNYVYINDKGYIIRNKQGKAIRMIGAAENITERKKTALAIEESEQRYKMFVQQSTEGIWRIELNEAIHIDTPLEKMTDYCYKNAYIAECNDAFAKMYGYKKAKDIIGTPLNKILPETNPLNMGYLLKFFTNGFKVQEEISYEIDNKGNQIIFVNNMVGIVEDNHLKRTWGTQRNITEQYTAERALIESENHLRAIVETDPECIKLLNKDGIILQMNPAGLSMIGADCAEQVVGKKAVELVLPEFKDAFKQLIKEVFTGKPAKLIFEIMGFKGKKLFMETHCVPLKNGTGEIDSLLAVTRDVTESKTAQAQLMASEEKYRYLFNNNPASIIIWDLDTFEILGANDTAVELYGYSRDEFLHLNVLDLRSYEDQALFKTFVINYRHQQFKKETFNWKHLTKNGSSIMMEITSHLITYKGKDAVLALGNNITEKVHLENSLSEERQIRQQQITEAVIMGQEKERTELGEELHDNINQILASTKLYIECAIKDKNPRMDLIAESKLLLEKAMTEIRNLSKSLLPPSLGEIGLQQALHEMVENINQMNNLIISINWNINDENDICNKLKLTIFRIAQEQLNNVIKHAEAKNVIINIKKADGKIQMSIKDDGLGFNTALKRNGVGLRNISSRAEVNNGTVSIISNPGEGCELIVTFSEIELSKKTIINV